MVVSQKKLKVESSTDNEGCNERRPNSDLGSNSTKTPSPSTTGSTSSNPDDGFRQTNQCLRSVLVHPMCLPLVIYLNDVPFTQYHPNFVWTALNGFATDDDCCLRENVFAATALDWNSGESDFTKKLLFNINHCKIGESLLKTDGEKQIVGNRGETGKVDLIFREKESESSIVALFEFGLNSNIWWKKQNQILKYVNILRTSTDHNYKFDQPILLSVITINENESKSSDDKIIKWTKDTREAEKVASLESNMKRIKENVVAPCIEDIHFEARFGVFLCIPKGKNEFRIALLWRHDTKTLKDASTQFGKVLFAVQLCSNFCSNSKVKENSTLYKYLGPNCCKIGDCVFRSYDNRLRPTDRRPTLYLNRNITINDVQGPIAQTVLKIENGNELLDFGESVVFESILDEMDWLWRYQGKLLIVSTPYHDGVHYAMRPYHFLPIINHLQQLHRQNIVHGDIRAYNMVLKYITPSSVTDQAAIGVSSNNVSDSNSCDGWLIDLDFGGKHDFVSYPKGYKYSLDDGKRPGREGNKITIMDDWKSLIGLILRVYDFVDKEEAEPTLEQMGLFYQKREGLESYRAMKVDSNHPLLSDYEKPAKLLRDYIHLISDVYDVKPDPEFEFNLIKCGLWSARDSLKASEAATGSPPKK